MIAASGASKALLREEFPSLTFIELPGYDIKVGKNRTDTIFRMMGSIPKILIRIKRERAWLKAFVGRERVDLVISDNRYGLALSNVVCVFITHQLVIRTPFGGWADALLQRMNYRLIRRFSGCWIPDVENDGGLAGALSHPAKFPSIPVRYIGWLSRFAARPVPETGGYILVLLSGPEPQRTVFETLILRQASGCPFRIVLVRGLPGGGRLPVAALRVRHTRAARSAGDPPLRGPDPGAAADRLGRQRGRGNGLPAQRRGPGCRGTAGGADPAVYPGRPAADHLPATVRGQAALRAAAGPAPVRGGPRGASAPAATRGPG